MADRPRRQKQESPLSWSLTGRAVVASRRSRSSEAPSGSGSPSRPWLAVMVPVAGGAGANSDAIHAEGRFDYASASEFVGGQKAQYPAARNAGSATVRNSDRFGFGSMRGNGQPFRRNHVTPYTQGLDSRWCLMTGTCCVTINCRAGC